MKSNLVGCLAATALGAAIVATTPAVAFRGGGGFGGMSGGGMRFHPMPFGGRFGGFGDRTFTRQNVFSPGGRRFVGVPLAGRDVFANRFHHFPFGRQFAFRHHRHFRDFAFLGVPYASDYGYDGCWRQTWTPYGWRWRNICYDYSYGY
jgi:hypothetical protein